MSSKIVHPISGKNRIVKDGNKERRVPHDWSLLEPGDATLTRRVKAAGEHWVMKAKRGKRVISIGVWAPKQTIERERQKLVSERRTPEYQERLKRQRQRRDREEKAYRKGFERAIVTFLDFPPCYAEMAREMSVRIARFATPVGSGTVARTRQIPIAERAEAAVIAWMRHCTTTYDTMQIAKVKGARKEVRRKLARQSREILNAYRAGESRPADCPLLKALAQTEPKSTEEQEFFQPPTRPASKLNPTINNGSSFFEDPDFF
jgi:hypothetical protein